MNYELIKSADFCGTPCDIYSDESSEMFMTATQLGSCLGYSEPRKSISKIVSRNEYLENIEFSGVVNLTTPGGTQETRIFTEDGIYEVTMLAKTEKAKEFRAFVRKLIKSIRKNEMRAVPDYSELSPQLQFLISLEQKQTDFEKRLSELEKKVADVPKIQEEAIKATLEFGRIGILQRNEIVRAVKKRAIEICCYAETYDKVGKSVIDSIYKSLQKHFEVSSYLDLMCNQYTDAMILIQYFEPDKNLYLKVSHEQPKPNFGDYFEIVPVSK